jgi:hypothetical protein
LIVAGPVVDQDPVDPGTAPGPREMAQARAGPCIPPGLSPVDLPAPAAVLALALRVPASVPVLALVRPAPVSAAQVA